MVVVPRWLPAEQLVVVAAVVLAVVALSRLDGGGWQRRLRRRLLFGLPVGTLTVVGVVLAVYLFVQGGLANWNAPVTIPYRAWSYFYPLGMVTSSFAHSGPGHLVGNLVSTLVFGSLAEYTVGHYPRRRGAHSFGSFRDNPYVRAFLVVPGVTVAVGLVAAVFSVGPVIGFSGVVFAFAGFALVSYPVWTLLGWFAARVLRVGYDAFVSPQPTVRSQPVFVTPWFAEIALQIHVLGFLVGVLVALWYRQVDAEAPSLPSPSRLAAGVLAFAVTNSFWAVYWFRGNDAFVLYRWLGVALVVGLAVVVATAAADSDRATAPRVDSFLAAARAAGPRQVALVVVVLAAASLAGPAVPVNLGTASSEELPGETVTVRDYEVAYAVDIENGMVGVVDVEAFGESTSVNTSGVVVRSERRSIWVTAVRAGRLELRGNATVRVGGLGWRDSVRASRTGWRVVGNETAYRVNLTHDGATTTAYTTPPRQAEPLLAGRNVTVVTTPDDFELVVTRGRTIGRASMPPPDGAAVAGGLVFERNGSRLYAVVRDTRVRIAQKETYERRR
jgi:membrane associated rhomboid family serine protease